MELYCPVCKTVKDSFDFHDKGVSDRLCKSCLVKINSPTPAPSLAEAVHDAIREYYDSPESRISIDTIANLESLSGYEPRVPTDEQLAILAGQQGDEIKVAAWSAVRMGRWSKGYACKYLGINVADWDDHFGDWDKEQDATEAALAGQQGGEPDKLVKAIASIRVRADNAYCDYIDQCRADGCLGADAKMDTHVFGRKELQAHTDAAKTLGRHQALNEAANLIEAALRGGE